jgi:hypothetical protein
MADDWRVTVTLAEGPGEGLLGLLGEHSLEDEARELLGGRAAVSADNSHVFVYTDTEDAAREALRILTELLETEKRRASFEIARWHPVAEEWLSPDVPLPATDEEIEHERDLLEAEETADSEASGLAEWEVRLDLPSHRDAVELAEQLSAAGYSLTRRWTYLLVGARNEEEAQELAVRLKDEAPAGTKLHVQPGGDVVWELMPANPFAIFGGLGG